DAGGERAFSFPSCFLISNFYFSKRSVVGWSAWLGGRPCEEKTNNQENRFSQQYKQTRKEYAGCRAYNAERCNYLKQRRSAKYGNVSIYQRWAQHRAFTFR